MSDTHAVAGESTLAVITFNRGTGRDAVAAVEAAGPTIVGLHGPGRFLVAGTADDVALAGGVVGVQSLVPLAPDDKPAPTGVGEPIDVWVVFTAGTAEASVVAEALGRLDGVTVLADTTERIGGLWRTAARCRSGGVTGLLDHPSVAAVDDRSPITLEDEVADLICAGAPTDPAIVGDDYLEWLEEMGVTGAGVAIGVVDSGIDESHPAFAGRITTADTTAGKHGTMVASQATGRYLAERDADGRVYGLGIAPGADVISQDRTGVTASRKCETTVSNGGPSGAAGSIQNNSWGQGTATMMDYRTEEAVWDGLVRNPLGPRSEAELTVCFSAGNKGQLGLTRPKAAKNVIVTGNSENLRPDTARADGDDPDDVYEGSGASSVGNCADGRIRPHVIAPGHWTAGANAGVPPGDPRFVSELIRWGTGTSAASPKTAGACALITEQWRRRHGHTPSPALHRALLVNTAVDTGFGGPVPNMRQGWGRIHLDDILRPGGDRFVVDQDVVLADGSDAYRVELEPVDPKSPVRLTLAWTDPPGPIGSGTPGTSPVVNKLILRVISDTGGVYHGNETAGGVSIPNAPRRAEVDNTQKVILPSGSWNARLTVEVVPVEILVDSWDGSVGDPRQDFALAADNARVVDGGDDPSPVVVVTTDADDDAGGSDVGAVEPHDDAGEPDDDGFWWEIDEELAVVAAPDAVTVPSLPPPADSHDEEAGDGGIPFAVALADAANRSVLVPSADADEEATGTTPTLDRVASAGVPSAGAPPPVGFGDLAAVLRPVDDPKVVLTVPAGANPSADALRRLRRLAADGRLVLVGRDRTTLTVLAQRLAEPSGVTVFLTDSSLDAAVQRAIASAFGATEVVTSSDGDESTFDVNTDDERIVIVGRSGEPLDVAPPGRPLRPVSSGDPIPGVRVVDDGTTTTVTVDSPSDRRLTGRWRLRSSRPPVVLAWSTTMWTTRCHVRADAATDVEVAVFDGATLDRVSFVADRAIDDEGGEEVDTIGNIVLELDEEDVDEADGVPTARARTVTIPGPNAVPHVTTGRLRVEGHTSHGEPFARETQLTHLSLAPRRAWRHATASIEAFDPRVEVVRDSAGTPTMLRLPQFGGPLRLDGPMRDLVARLEPDLPRASFLHSGGVLRGVRFDLITVGDPTDRPNR